MCNTLDDMKNYRGNERNTYHLPRNVCNLKRCVKLRMVYILFYVCFMIRGEEKKKNSTRVRNGMNIKKMMYISCNEKRFSYNFFSLAVCVMAFLCFSCQWKKDSTEEWRDREREKRKKKLWLLRLWFKRNALFNWKLVKQKYQWKEFHFFSKDSNLQPIITNWTSLLAFSFGKIVRGNGADVGTLRQTNSLLSRKIRQVFHLGKYLREARMQS